MSLKNKLFFGILIRKILICKKQLGDCFFSLFNANETIALNVFPFQENHDLHVAQDKTDFNGTFRIDTNLFAAGDLLSLGTVVDGASIVGPEFLVPEIQGDIEGKVVLVCIKEWNVHTFNAQGPLAIAKWVPENIVDKKICDLSLTSGFLRVEKYAVPRQ